MFDCCMCCWRKTWRWFSDISNQPAQSKHFPHPDNVHELFDSNRLNVLLVVWVFHKDSGPARSRSLKLTPSFSPLYASSAPQNVNHTRTQSQPRKTNGQKIYCTCTKRTPGKQKEKNIRQRQDSNLRPRRDLIAEGIEPFESNAVTTLLRCQGQT